MSIIVSQTGWMPMHSVMFVAVQSTQVLVVVLQAGWSAGQFWSAVQATQVWVVVLQAGVDVNPMHCVFETHCTQEAAVPSTPSQTSPPVHGVPDAAFAHTPVAQELHGPAHEAVQQMPLTQLPLAHWLLPVHAPPFAIRATQVLLVVLQKGVAPKHALLLVAVHCTQVSVVRLQAGVAGEQSWSRLHCAQVWLAVLHATVGAEHCAFETHCTQEAAVPSTPSQTCPPVHPVPDGWTPHMPAELQILHGPLHAA